MLKKIFVILSLKVINIIGGLHPNLYLKFLVPLLRAGGMKIGGKPQFISHKCNFDDFDRIEIGSMARFARDVKFITHDYSYTTLLNAKEKPQERGVARLSRIKVGDNVFMGVGVIVLPGTTIGDNVIIGAGSVARGKLESGWVYSGNPAKQIMSFDELYERTSARADSLELRFDKF